MTQSHATNPCDQLTNLHAYHDGELSPSTAAVVEAHARACPACAAELAFLRRTHTQLTSIAAPALPADFTANLLARIADEPDRPSLRLAWWLTAAAAAVFVACVVQLQFVQDSQAATGSPPTWEVVAASINDEPTAGGSDEQRMARWIVADLVTAAGGDSSKGGGR